METQNEVINGIDVSKWQSEVKWDQVASDRPDIRFAIVKASEGVGYTDPRFSENWEGAKQAGLIRGAYHFARVSVVGLDKLSKRKSSGEITTEEFNKLRDEGLRADAEAEATWFAEQMGPLGKDDLDPVLDIEWDKRCTVKAKEIIFWCHAFLAKLEELTGRRPIIYTGRNYWRYKLAKSKTFDGYTLWLVQYTTKPEPHQPIQTPLTGKATWKWLPKLWQWSHTRPVAGIQGKGVDENRFLGTEKELLALAGHVEEKPEPVPEPEKPEAITEKPEALIPEPEKPAVVPPPKTVEDIEVPWYADLVSWLIQLFSGIAKRSKTPMKNPERDMEHETRIS